MIRKIIAIYKGTFVDSRTDKVQLVTQGGLPMISKLAAGLNMLCKGVLKKL